MIPIAKPDLGEREAEAARRAILSGWVTQGPEVAAFEHEFAAFVGAPHACAVSNCTVGAAAGAARGRRGAGRRGDHRQPLVHRHRQRRALLRRAAGLRRHRARRRSTSTAAPRERDRATHARHPVRAPDRACRATSRRSSTSRGGARPAGDRGRGLRPGQRDPGRRRLGADRPAARRHRVLLLPSAQDCSRPATAACSRPRTPIGIGGSACCASTA